MTGENSLYFNDPVSLAPIFNVSRPTSALQRLNSTISTLKDQRIITIYHDLRYYTDILNQAHATKRKRTAAEFQKVICSIQYRLIQLQGSVEDILSECVRLAMLAVITTTFQVSGSRLQYPYLAKRLKERCFALEISTTESQDFMLWVLIIGVIALYGTEEEWLRRRWQGVVSVTTWPEARSRLKQIMWINAIHERPGNRAFQILNGVSAYQVQLHSTETAESGLF